MKSGDGDRTRTITISTELFSKLEPLAKQSEFDTVDQFVEFVLAEVAATTQQPMTADQEAKVTERLRNLGYM